MAEQIDLTVPTPATPGRVNYRTSSIKLDRDNRLIELVCRADNGEQQQFIVRDVAGATDVRNFIRNENKADHTIQSFERAVYSFFIVQGVIAGSVSGAPD